MSARLQTLDEFIADLKVETDDPASPAAEVARIRDRVIRYIGAIATDSEVRLDPEDDEAAHAAARREIVLKATYLTEFDVSLEKGEADVDAPKSELGKAFDDPDGYLGFKLKQAQRDRLRDFVAEARADGKISAGEIVDFMVLQEEISGLELYEAPRSSTNGARMLLQAHGIDPTAVRVGMLARQVDEAARPADEDDDEA